MDIDLVQAQWVLGLFPADQIPEFAAQAMMQGFEGPSILELVSFHLPTRWEIKPEVFDAALKEMGRQPILKGEAALRMANVTASRILRNQVHPRDGATEILNWVSRAGSRDAPEALLRFRYEIDRLEDRRASNREYDLKVVELAWGLVNG